MQRSLTLDELAGWTGEEPDELRRWHALGLLPGDGEAFAPVEIERARLIRFALGRGYTADRLAEISADQGYVIGAFVDSFGGRRGEPLCGLNEAVDRAGIDRDVFERFRSVLGLHDRQFAYGDDVEALRLVKTAVDGGLPVDVLAQLLRVMADATAKIADSASRLFHLYVHEPLRAEGTGGAELLRATNAIGLPLLELLEPAVVYFQRRAWDQAFAEDMMLHLAEDATAPGGAPGEFERAFLFVDLSGFTPMTEAMGDAAAAEVVERFAELVREATARCSGQVVKQIGDEFMLVFPEGRSATTCGLTIQDDAAAEAQFPALRLGAHFGSVLYREGDYVGTAVNTAARVAAAASRHQFLVTGSVRDHLDDLDIEIVEVGARRLKGLSENVVLFEVRVPATRRAKNVDPVCHMELDEDSTRAQLDWGDRHLHFCSEECLRRFLENPDHYSMTGQRFA